MAYQDLEIKNESISHKYQRKQENVAKLRKEMDIIRQYINENERRQREQEAEKKEVVPVQVQTSEHYPAEPSNQDPVSSTTNRVGLDVQHIRDAVRMKKLELDMKCESGLVDMLKKEVETLKDRNIQLKSKLREERRYRMSLSNTGKGSSETSFETDLLGSPPSLS
jgi:hypothetical protein